MHLLGWTSPFGQLTNCAGVLRFLRSQSLCWVGVVDFVAVTVIHPRLTRFTRISAYFGNVSNFEQSAETHRQIVLQSLSQGAESIDGREALLTRS
jgi:hypothetical protein